MEERHWEPSPAQTFVVTRPATEPLQDSNVLASLRRKDIEAFTVSGGPLPPSRDHS